MLINKRLLFPFAILSIFILMTGCESDPPLDIDYSATTRYPAEVGRIVQTNCAVSGCHVGENPPDNLNSSTWENAFEGSDFGAVIIPYEHDWSHFHQHINTFEDLGIRADPRMPPEPAEMLSREDVLIIQNWINEGALNYKGEYYWAEQETRSNGKVFVLCANSDLVAVVDLESNRVMRFVEVGTLEGIIESPHFITLSPDNQYFYVTLIRGSAVEKYRTDNYERVGRVEVGPDPALLYLNETGDRMVVTHWNGLSASPKLSVINSDDMSIVQEIVGDGSLIDHTHGVAITKDFRTIYVSAEWGNYYAKFNLDANGIIEDVEKFPLDPANPLPQSSQAYGPYQLLLTEDESKLFVTCNKKDQVFVYETATDNRIAVIDVADYPRLMAFDPVSNRVFVACRDEENASLQGAVKGAVSVIDVNTLTEETRLFRLGHQLHGISVDVVNRRLYISSENSGGVDPPHHPLEGNSFPPGKYNVVDLNTLEKISDMETEVAEFPNAIVVSN